MAGYRTFVGRLLPLMMILVGCVENLKVGEYGEFDGPRPEWVHQFGSEQEFKSYASGVNDTDLEIRFSIFESSRGVEVFLYSAIQPALTPVDRFIFSRYGVSADVLKRSFLGTIGPPQFLHGYLVQSESANGCDFIFEIKLEVTANAEVMREVHAQLAKRLWIPRERLCLGMNSVYAASSKRSYLAHGIPVHVDDRWNSRVPPASAQINLSATNVNSADIIDVTSQTIEGPVMSAANVDAFRYAPQHQHLATLARLLAGRPTIHYGWSSALAVPYGFFHSQLQRSMKVEECMTAEQACSRSYGNHCQALSGQCLALAQRSQDNRLIDLAAFLLDRSRDANFEIDRPMHQAFMSAVFMTGLMTSEFKVLNTVTENMSKSDELVIDYRSRLGTFEYTSRLSAPWTGDALSRELRSQFSTFLNSQSSGDLTQLASNPLSFMIRSDIQESSTPTFLRVQLRPLEKVRGGFEVAVDLQRYRHVSRYFMELDLFRDDVPKIVARRSQLVESTLALSGLQLDQLRQIARSFYETKLHSDVTSSYLQIDLEMSNNQILRVMNAQVL